MSAYEQAVFISYAWGGEREEIVNKIDQALQKRGIKIVRDKRDLGYKGSIREFMERIGQGNCVIVVISDKYLRSHNCMFELVEIAENKQFHDRIFPVVLGDADIFKAVRQLQYIKYWEDEIKELKEGIKGVEPTNLQGIYQKLDLYDRIRDHISKLIDILSDMNTLTPEVHQESDFSTLYEAITQRMRNAAETFSDGALQKEHPAPQQARRPLDPVALATEVTSLLAPFLARSGEALPGAVDDLWNAIADRFKERVAAAEAANDLAKDAENPDNQEVFALQLKKVLREDPDFASQLGDRLEAAKSKSGISNVGEGVVATNGSIGNVFKTGGNISGSTINISSNIQSSSGPSGSKK